MQTESEEKEMWTFKKNKSNLFKSDLLNERWLLDV